MDEQVAREQPAPQRVRTLRRRLLAWYAAEGGAFPWRGARDPYAALVAAVCAQQTQMSRVLPLWERWMAAFPTLGDAAAADAAAALRVWERAGYPRRALALVAAAQVCAREHGGALPRDEAALLALPGVGPFTAAIVRCFGWGDDGVAVDTNVVRVLGRVVHGDLQPARETPRGALLATAQRLLPRGDAARWNPALMDFGARVCT
ncbi:MAG: A/G-specific adenine glycosylase, partial [Chloroflexi bacterium]|nr:A/G-specific adenine glycosylase [Chloroflexota bacterium]